ncbi:MAG: ABC transporter substrate-binding protein, partial [Burkholderiaceae bacterium]|nr:ABC transporter substrate-binding protein [Burkholderiaceae bacterium]
MWKPLASVFTAALALSALLIHAPAVAQEVPLRIVVGYAPGGSTDRVARIVAEKLGTKLGAPVIVDNKP